MQTAVRLRTCHNMTGLGFHGGSWDETLKTVERRRPGLGVICYNRGQMRIKKY